MKRVIYWITIKIIRFLLRRVLKKTNFENVRKELGL